MKAIRVENFGDAHVMQHQDVKIPSPQHNEVLIKINAAGINPVDTYIRSGQYLPSRLPSLPYTPGGDVSGEIVQVGAGVTEFSEGDKVFTVLKTVSGGYAEYATASTVFTAKLPSRLSFAEGAALGVPYFTAYRALVSIGQATKGDTVLIHGASGGVGIAAMQIAKFLGLNVFGTAGTEDGLELIRKHSCEAFNHRENGYLDKLKVHKFDLIIEMLSNVNLQHDMEMLAKNGRVMIVGCRGEITINPRLLMGIESQIRGVGLTAFWDLTEKDSEMLNTIDCLDKMDQANKLKPVLAEKYSLNEATLAHNQTIQNSGCLGKKYFLNVFK